MDYGPSAVGSWILDSGDGGDGDENTPGDVTAQYSTVQGMIIFILLLKMARIIVSSAGQQQGSSWQCCAVQGLV